MNLAKDERGKDMACGHSFSGGEPITLKCKREERKKGRKEERKEGRKKGRKERGEERKEGRKEGGEERKERKKGRKEGRKKEREKTLAVASRSLGHQQSGAANWILWYIMPSNFKCRSFNLPENFLQLIHIRLAIKQWLPVVKFC